MIKNFCLLILLLVLPAHSYADFQRPDIKTCGRYHVGGVIRKDKINILNLIVNESTKSQYQFKIKTGQISNFAGFIDESVSFDADIIKLDKTRGEVANPENFKRELTDPLHPLSSTGFTLIKPRACQK